MPSGYYNKSVGAILHWMVSGVAAAVGVTNLI
ncbi:MAG: hypothetical protein PWQ41_1413 [Bacillota bacterium]|jgi:hypothetical protein|nr:hypothetical protein [Bacillota bacterium]